MEVLPLLRGATFCILWYFSILFGFLALYCPLLPLLLFNNYAFRTITDKIFAFWELYPTAILQMLFGTKIYVHGDYVDPDETAMVIMNHRTRVDWNFSWLCMFHATRIPPHLKAGDDGHNKAIPSGSDAPANGDHGHKNGGINAKKALSNGNSKHAPRKTPLDWLRMFNQKLRMKYVLKDEIKHIPGAGWVMQLNCFIYIKRCWEQDEERISRVLEYFRDLDYTYQLLIFPEGTDLTLENLKKSDAHAKKFNLEVYRQVLHPRVRGFSHLARALRPRLRAVYDVAVAYAGPAGLPGQGCSLKDLLAGRFPPEVHFSIKRYSASTLPEDEESLGNWLNERWKSKEEQLKSFYKHGRFVDAVNRLEYRPRSELLLALGFWTLLVLGYPVALVTWRWTRWLAMLGCATFALLGACCPGFQHLEVACYNLKKSASALILGDRRQD